MIEMESAFLKDIMPQNLLADDGVRNAATAIDTELRKISGLCKACLLISRIDELPSEIIDILARQWHVDFYDDTLPVETKRKLVKQSIAWHRIKGTVAAVQEMVAAVWDGCEVSEWFDYGGEPYHFRVVNITAAHVDEEVIRQVLRAVRATKNVRSWLDGLNFLREIENGFFVGGALGVHRRYAVKNALPKNADIGAAISFGAFPGTHSRIAAGRRRTHRGKATPAASGILAGHRKITVTQKEES